MKFRHGQYFLNTQRGFFLFNTYLKRGRAFLNDQRIIDFTYKTHPKLVKSLLIKGTLGINPYVQEGGKGWKKKGQEK